ncbi:MAG: ABC transporter permease [Verrucomicrobia bacterium]|nr:ABC transporter permease [Verrucomicrobiota bacterium]
MSTFLAKLRDLLRRRTRTAELDEEMQTHFELLVEQHRRAGHSEAEARRLARLAFGGALSTREDAQRALGWETLESIFHDLRLAARGLARRPFFALGLVAILALGLGVTTAIATLVRGVLLEALPVPRPQELQLVQGHRNEPLRVSAPTVTRLEQHPLTQGRVIAYSSSPRLALRLGDGPAEPINVQFVNGTYFSALQIAPARGRLLTPADDAPGQVQAVAVVSARWWRTKLASDPAALGRTFRLNGETVTIVGIAPESFAGVALGDTVDAWLPLGLIAPLRVEPSASIVSNEDHTPLERWRTTDNVMWLSVLLRQPATGQLQGVLESCWRPQLEAIQAVIDDAGERERFARNKPRFVSSPQGYSNTRNDFRAAGLTLSLLVAAVVLVTVANSSTLLLLRMLARRREMGVRLALGAGHGRLARWAMMEALVLSAAGGLAGIALGVWLTPILATWLVPNAADDLPGVDATLLAGLGLLVVLLGLFLGAAPAWLMTRLSPHAVIQQHGMGAQGSLRIGRSLIVLQLVLSVLLVGVAGALALDLRRVLSIPPGFARESVITTFFDLTAAGIPTERHRAVQERLAEAARTSPQVRAVGFAAHGALSGSISRSRIYFRGEGVVQQTEGTQRENIDPDYLGAMGVALLRGRNLTAADAAEKAPRVALISQTLARQAFGAADPLGRRFGYDANDTEKDFEVVGLVADSRINGVRSDAPPMFYLPLGAGESPSCLVVRVEGNAVGAREALEKRIGAVEPTIMYTRWLTLEERTQRWIRNDLATVRLTAGFGALATGLAMLGVLGALGYLVATRSREIAVKLAVGAPPSRIWRDVVREAAGLGVIGSTLGFVLAALLPRLLSSWMLTGLRTEWLALLAAALVGLAAAVLGGLLPARRAARVNPLALLRAE